MIHSRPIPELIGEVVTLTAASVLPTIQANQLAIKKQYIDSNATVSDITAVRFAYGHINELEETFREQLKAGYKVWPTVFLITDLPEQFGGKTGYGQEVTLQMGIVYCSLYTFKAAQREEVSMVPILRPLYEELIKQIARSKHFVTGNQKSISHIETARYDWGTERALGNEFIDAIEISNLKLRVRP